MLVMVAQQYESAQSYALKSGFKNNFYVYFTTTKKESIKGYHG
jgi:hypothetical protein